jgi:hypothetical protein
MNPGRIAALALLFAHCVAAQATTKTLSATPDLRIDATAENLSSINWIGVAPNGTIAVLQPEDLDVLFFSPTGKRLGTYGRKGAGPGEFRNMANIGWVGDTLWVNDFGNSRTTMISPDRKLVRDLAWGQLVTTAKGDTVGTPDFIGIMPMAIYADGSMLTWIRPRTKPQPTWYPLAADRQPFLRVSRTAVLQRVLAYYSSQQCGVRVNGGSISIPFCQGAIRDAAPDGSNLAILDQANPTTPTAKYTLTVVSSRGDTIYSRSLTSPAIAISKHLADSTIESRIHPASGRPLPEAFASALRSVTVPEYQVPVTAVIAGRDGTVWLRMQSEGATAPWEIVDPRGSLVGTLHLPRTLQPVVVSRTIFWGIDTDSDGLESVVRERVKE